MNGASTVLQMGSPQGVGNVPFLPMVLRIERLIFIFA